MNEIVVAVWVLIAGHTYSDAHRLTQEFTSKERCEAAAKRFQEEFNPDGVVRYRAFCVPK